MDHGRDAFQICNTFHVLKNYRDVLVPSQPSHQVSLDNYFNSLYVCNRVISYMCIPPLSQLQVTCQPSRRSVILDWASVTRGGLLMIGLHIHQSDLESKIVYYTIRYWTNDNGSFHQVAARFVTVSIVTSVNVPSGWSADQTKQTY